MEKYIFLTIASLCMSIYFFRNPGSSILQRFGSQSQTKSNLKKEAFGIIDKLAHRIALKLSQNSLDKYRHKLQMANNPMGLGAEQFYAIKIILIILFLPLGLFLFIQTGVLFLMLLFVAMPFLVPDILLDTLCKKRQVKVKRSLLDAIELLWVPCDSGMSFNRAIRHLAQETDNIVIQELDRCLIEVETGKNKIDAFKDLIYRNNVRELQSFVQSLLYNQEMGSPISDFLYKESEKMRNLRHTKIQEIGQKVGVKVLVSVVVFMGPAFLILIFGPLLTHIDASQIIGNMPTF